MVVFRGRVRRWREDNPGGPAVIDIPLEMVPELGGRRQMRVAGSLNGVPFYRQHHARRGRRVLRGRDPRSAARGSSVGR